METIVLSSGDSDGESELSSPGNRQSTTIRDPRLRPGTAYAERSTRLCPTGRRQPGGFGKATTPSLGSSARTPPRRAASSCAPDSDSEASRRRHPLKSRESLPNIRTRPDVASTRSPINVTRVQPGHGWAAGSNTLAGATTTTGITRHPTPKTPATKSKENWWKNNMKQIIYCNGIQTSACRS